jgi:putative MATE family efflux protein
LQRFDRSIVDGPLVPAVWKLAWPTMLQNVIAGLQGIIDHVMVGHYVGFTANAAIGVSWQIFLVVVVFTSSLFAGMGVLVARFAGAGEPEKVNRVVHQAFLTSLVLSVVIAGAGWVLAPYLLDIVNAAPPVKAAALPFLRMAFAGNIGMMMIFMLGGAFRAAGDAGTPLRLGLVATVMNAAFNIVLIPRLGAVGAAVGTVSANLIVAVAWNVLLFSGRGVVRVPRPFSLTPDWTVIRSILKFGLPTGLQGIAMNVAGVILLRFIGSLQYSAAAQAAYAVGYSELFSLITWTSIGLMSAAATIAGQNLGAGKPERSVAGARVAARIGLGVAAIVGSGVLAVPGSLLGIFGMRDAHVVEIGAQLLRFLTVSGFFVTVALVYNGALQGAGDTKSPLYISLISQIAVPLTYCATMDAIHGLRSADIWTAIVLGHVTRCTLGVLRFRQGRWRHIKVDIGAGRSRDAGDGR